MDINKAIKKQKRSYRGFLLSLCFIFFILPVVLLISREWNIFFISYLVAIEFLIMATVLLRSNFERLTFKYENYKLNVKWGFFSSCLSINCEKVAMVHTEDNAADFDIIIISSIKFRNKRTKPVDLEFLKNHSYAATHYNRIKKQNFDINYFYTIINKGKYKKYILIDSIYKYCLYAFFTDDCIEKIKLYRESSKVRLEGGINNG
jgi:hypothetical protein